MATTRVIVTDHFKQYEAELDRAVQRALGKAAGVGVAAARTTPTRYRIQPITSKVRATRAEKTSKGWQVLIVSPDWRSLFFLFGTYQRRKKVLKRPGRRKATGQNRGVKPVRFLQAARREAGKRIAYFLEREMRFH